MTSTDPAPSTPAPSTPAPSTPTQQRLTRQQRAVADALAGFEGFRSAQEIHEDLGGSVGLATVYRTLQKLSDADEVDMLRTADGEAIYRRCSDTHHHHLVCRVCGRTVEVEGPAVERWTRTIAAEHGFGDVAHTLEIFGTCAACAARS